LSVLCARKRGKAGAFALSRLHAATTYTEHLPPLLASVRSSLPHTHVYTQPLSWLRIAFSWGMCGVLPPISRIPTTGSSTPEGRVTMASSLPVGCRFMRLLPTPRLPRIHSSPLAHARMLRAYPEPRSIAGAMVLNRAHTHVQMKPENTGDTHQGKGVADV
jgi:hypothetical protein